MRKIWIALAVLALTATACSDDDKKKDSAKGTTSSSVPADVATSSSSNAPTTARPSPPAGDWDGARFDLGTVSRLERRDGRVAVVFDRKSNNGKSGKDFTEEPILYGYRSGEVTNDNDQLRTFYASNAVDILRLGNRDAVCDPEREVEPVWNKVGLDQAFSSRVWVDWILVTLTFDGAGTVTRIRFSNDC